MEDLSKLLKLAEKQRDEHSRINGRIDGIKKNLKDNGYRGEVHAKKELTALKLKRKKLRASFERKLSTFKKLYAKELQKVD